VSGEDKPTTGYITVKQAAELTHTSRSFIWKEIYEGRIPTRTFGKRARRIPVSWLEERAS
jgi:excisionase family DNA binding protein